VKADEHEKPHVTEEHFLAMLDYTHVATLPARRLHPSMPPATTPGDWWTALLMTCWVTGARIDAILHLRWDDVDWQSGRVLSRAADLKQRKDTRPAIAAALPYLTKIRGADPRLLPWNHDKRQLYDQLYRIQRAAGISLSCPKARSPEHKCGEGCTSYGFHAFRYAHARFNHANPELQNQMGHATAATTDHYRRWAQRQIAEYDPYMPPAIAGGKQRENSGDDSGDERSWTSDD
jgi:integrase